MSNFLTKINNQIRIFCNFFKINPHKHWNVLLYIFFTLIAVLILFSFYLLFEIRNEQRFQVKIEQQEDQILLKEDLLKNTMGTYDQKAKRVSDITNNNISIYKDPSL